MTSWPELAAVVVARSSWPSTLVVLFLIGGVVGVLLLNQRSHRRFHEGNARRQGDEPRP